MAWSRPKKTDDAAVLYEYAVGALARKMRSVAELKRLLRRRVEPGETGEALVEAVILKLKDQRYLNDAQYAAAYTSYRKENEKFGKMRVISGLKARGVHSEVIEQAVTAAYDGVNDEKLAREFLQRKRLAKPKDQKSAARVFRALLRAGFSSRTALAILKKWDVEDEVLIALEGEQE